jgi:hypothetical protein
MGMEPKAKRDMDERHSLPADDPEAALKALIAVDPESEPVPQFDAYASDGVGGRTWRIRCRTCGWEVAGTGPTPPEALAAKSAHRCGAARGD